jgi:hypothetical protein
VLLASPVSCAGVNGTGLGVNTRGAVRALLQPVRRKSRACDDHVPHDACDDHVPHDVVCCAAVHSASTLLKLLPHRGLKCFASDALRDSEESLRWDPSNWKAMLWRIEALSVRPSLPPSLPPCLPPSLSASAFTLTRTWRECVSQSLDFISAALEFASALVGHSNTACRSRARKLRESLERSLRAGTSGAPEREAMPRKQLRRSKRLKEIERRARRRARRDDDDDDDDDEEEEEDDVGHDYDNASGSGEGADSDDDEEEEDDSSSSAASSDDESEQMPVHPGLLSETPPPFTGAAYYGSRVAAQPVCGKVRCRMWGHGHHSTGIQEAVFWGGGDDALSSWAPRRRRLGRHGFIVGGSDDGYVFVWDVETSMIVGAFYADNDIVNCVQPNPVCPWLATSGIENTVRVWTPGPGPLKPSPIRSSRDGHPVDFADIDDVRGVHVATVPARHTVEPLQRRVRWDDLVDSLAQTNLMAENNMRTAGVSAVTRAVTRAVVRAVARAVSHAVDCTRVKPGSVTALWYIDVGAVAFAGDGWDVRAAVIIAATISSATSACSTQRSTSYTKSTKSNNEELTTVIMMTTHVIGAML